MESITTLEAILNMIDKEHSIILSEEIAILGNNDYIIDKQNRFDYVRKIYDDCQDIKVGDCFTVIDSDGVILFDEYVDASAIVFEQDNTLGYLFKLKDYTIKDTTWGILEESLTDEFPALIYYKNGIIQTNCEELQEKYLYNNNIKCELSQKMIVKPEINGVKYSVKVLSYENFIYSLSVSKNV